MLPAIMHAMSHSTRLRSAHATCNATSDEEQAESIGKQGPVKPSVYEIRPEAIDVAFAVPCYTRTDCVRDARCLAPSIILKTPTYTPTDCY